MGIFTDSLTVVAPIMGLLLVAATFYMNNLAGDIKFASGKELKAASFLFFISFVGGAGILLVAIWQLVSKSLMYWILSAWIVLSTLAGSVLTGRLAYELIRGTDDISLEDTADSEIPIDESSEDSSLEADTGEKEAE